MKRAITAIVGWILITAGLVAILAVGISIYSLIAIFFGFFFRLIYNSEKYKYFKLLNLELLNAYGKSDFQQKAVSICLFGFYRAVFDFCMIIVLPFIIVPKLSLPWYIDWLIALIYIAALKPIFTGIDTVDSEQIRQMVINYGIETNKQSLK